MHSIAVVGHICLDLTPELGAGARIDPGQLIGVGPLRLSLGGCVANTAKALADLGLPVRVAATVGDDELGDLIVRTVRENPGLRGTPVVIPGQTTSYSLVLEPSGLDRTFWHHTGANEAFTGADVDVSGDLLHIGYPPLLPGLLTDDGDPLVALLQRARDGGATTSLDLAVVDPDTPVGRLDWERILRRAMALTDVVSPSLDDLTSALGTGIVPEPSAAAFAELLLAWGAGVVAVSAGADGLLLRTGSADRLRNGGRALAPLADRWADLTLHLPPVPVSDVSTTNGAGDASTAGLLFALARGASAEEAASLATTCSAALISGSRPTPARIADLQPELGGVVGGSAED